MKTKITIEANCPSNKHIEVLLFKNDGYILGKYVENGKSHTVEMDSNNHIKIQELANGKY